MNVLLISFAMTCVGISWGIDGVAMTRPYLVRILKLTKCHHIAFRMISWHAKMLSLPTHPSPSSHHHDVFNVSATIDQILALRSDGDDDGKQYPNIS